MRQKSIHCYSTIGVKMCLLFERSLTTTLEHLDAQNPGVRTRMWIVSEETWQQESAIFDCATGRGASGASLNSGNRLARDNGWGKRRNHGTAAHRFPQSEPNQLIPAVSWKRCGETRSGSRPCEERFVGKPTSQAASDVSRSGLAAG